MRTIRELLSALDGKLTRREIEEELDLHLELLTQEHVKADMSWEEATASAHRRFGNVERIRDQCVEITRRSRPLMRALKSFLILVFVTGVLVRVFSPEIHVTRVGDVLMAVAVLGRLLLYLRGLNPSNFRANDETSSPLMLNSEPQSPFICDQRCTPLERVIFDK